MTREPDPNQPVKLVFLRNQAVAQLLVDRLAEAGIEAFVFGTASEGTGFISQAMSFGGTTVSVRRSDFDRARPIAAEFEAESQAESEPESDNDE